MKSRGMLRLVMATTVLVAAWASNSVFAQSDWIQQLETGCNSGEGQDCANLGNQLAGGYVVPKDPVRARAAFEKGCQLDNIVACAGLYEALSRGEGGPEDPVRAKALGDKVCKTAIIALKVHLQANGLCPR